jgi:type IX secretion system PorP/SprF family membrane protein
MKRIFILFLMLQNLYAQAQIIPYTNMYQRNWQMVNPAAINGMFYEVRGVYPTFLSTIQGSWQWIGTKESPNTVFASVEGFLKGSRKNPENTKIGAFVLRDKAGAFTNYNVGLNYTYKIKFKDKSSLYTGIGIGVTRHVFEIGNLKTNIDPLLAEPIISKGSSSGQASFGLFYVKRFRDQERSKIKFFQIYAGLGVTNLLSLHLNTDVKQKITFRNEKRISQSNISLIGGYVLQKKGIKHFLENYFIVRYASKQSFNTWRANTNMPFSIDFGARMSPFDTFFFGTKYGTNQQLGVEFGTYINYGQVVPAQISMQWNIPAGNRFARLGPSVEIAASIAWR